MQIFSIIYCCSISVFVIYLIIDAQFLKDALVSICLVVVISLTTKIQASL